MAEAFLQVLQEEINKLILDEIGLIVGVDTEMRKLASALTTIQAVLEDAEEKQLESIAIRVWLRKINDLAYEIDDILDECATQVSKLEHKKTKPYSLKNILYRHKIGRRMREANAKMAAVAAEREKFHLRELTAPNESEASASRETGSILNEPHRIQGRVEERDEIVDILVNQVKDKEELSVIPIVGIGGLGKTTLAQLVYNDPRVSEHFDTKIWVCVSENFDVKNLVKLMIDSATKGEHAYPDFTSQDALQHRLLDLLSHKRYLIVMDDVWNEDQDKWCRLKNIIACGSRGSSIVVTTRLHMVAGIMGTHPAHKLKRLSEEYCWLLMSQRAFGNEEKEYPTLEAIGKRIVKKCGGVPLAANALGGILRFKRKDEEWIRVEESEIWDLPEESLIFPALRLSYRNLPLRLRKCFAYCAVFPKDYEIKKQELIFHWMAQGYISSERGVEVEDVGDQIWNELVLRSLFQDLQIDGMDTRFKMHDLVHDLAQSVMENKVPGRPTECKFGNVSRNRIRFANLKNEHAAFPTIIEPEIDMSFVVMNLRCLRTLDASGTGIKDLPSEIGDLTHLRSLNLSGTRIRDLPNSICRLWNLKILNLNDCKKLVGLPENMRTMINLRHLFLERCASFTRMPSGMGELKSLKTLSVFIVRDGKGRKLGELGSLNLGGELTIKHLERVKNHMDAEKANICGKQNLNKLSLEWEYDGDNTSGLGGEDVDEKVLEALKPHPNLRILWIDGFRGRRCPNWMQNSTLGNIYRIDMRNCPNITCLPQAVAELPRLEFLNLCGLPELDYIIGDKDKSPRGENEVESKAFPFPSLKTLYLFDLSQLRGVSKKEVEQIFPSLEYLRITRCSRFILQSVILLSSIKVFECSSLSLTSFPELNNLAELWVWMDDNMPCIPIETLKTLTKIRSLTILNADARSLPEGGLRCLISLAEFSVFSSSTLTCFPDEWLGDLTGLRDLSIVGCFELTEMPQGIKNLSSLTSLTLVNLPKMVGLFESLQHLSSPLKFLHLQNLPSLTSLPDWLGNFASLHTLIIFECPNLASLPSSIQRMPNLKYLSIDGCPELEGRCERRKGEDWPKIAHIPNVNIWW